MKLSVLVPVYNAERFIEPFMRSLVAQQLADAEVVLVDDCSTDNSRVELERWCSMGVGNGRSDGACRGGEGKKRFEGIKVKLITREKNGGVSEARQTALDAAMGEYVIFADPDDMMDPGMYAGLLGTAEATGADFVWEDFWLEEDCRSGKRVNCRVVGEQAGENMICAILSGKLHGATWNKLIRRSFIEQCGARFLAERVGLCEDVDFLCQVLAANPKCVYHDGCHYRYRMVEGSATHSSVAKQQEALKLVAAHLETVLKTPRTRRFLRLWRFGNYASPIGGWWGKVLHIVYRLWRGCLTV